MRAFLLQEIVQSGSYYDPHLGTYFKYPTIPIYKNLKMYNMYILLSIVHFFHSLDFNPFLQKNISFSKHQSVRNWSTLSIII